MKKLLKNVLLVMLLSTMCITLVGCGKDKKENLNESKLIAVKEYSAGNYKQTTEITFKNDMAEEITITMECGDNSTAEAMKELFSSEDSLKDAEIRVEANKLIIKTTAKDFFTEEGIDYSDDKLSKDSIRKMFEDNDYTITEE
ncbi:MAG: hypothetical protein IJH12_05700 [Clostridia bacterium]|nr:hypothetical protein [Clostridia bacterium]